MAAGTDTSNYGALKQVYDGKAPIDVLQRRRGLFAELATDSERLKGTKLYTDIRVGGNEGIGAITENQAIPTPQHQRHLQPSVSPKIYVGTHQISDLVIAMGSDDEAAFAKVLEDDLASMARSMDKRLEQDVWRTGKTWHAAATATATSATHSVDAAWMLREFTYYDVYNSTLTTRMVTGVQVLGKSVSANQVVLDRAVTINSGERFVPQGELSNAPAEGKALTGLQAIIDDGTFATDYLNIDRTTNLNWQGIVYDAGGNPIDSDLLQRLLDRIMLNSEEDEPPYLCSNTLQRRDYLDLSTPQVRHMAPLNLDAGHNEILFNTIPWKIYVDCPVDEIHGMSAPPTKIFTPNGEMQYVTQGGSRFFQRQGYLGKWAARRAFVNLVCRKPHANFRIHTLNTRSV